MRGTTGWKLSMTVALMSFVAGGLFFTNGARGQDKMVAPKVLETLVQTIGETTYFLVRLEDVPNWPPARLREYRGNVLFDVGDNRPLLPVSLLAGAPRLVPQDATVESAYLLWPADVLTRLTEGIDEFVPDRFKPPLPVPNKEEVKQKRSLPNFGPGLVFVGRLRKAGPTKFLLTYTAVEEQAVPHPFREKESLKLRWPSRRQTAMAIDFSRAKVIPALRPPVGRESIAATDLEGLFGVGRSQYFALQAWITRDQGSGFYQFARMMNDRRYGIRVNSFGFDAIRGRDHDIFRRQFELTTGAAAIAETLQLGRLQTVHRPLSQGPRKVPVSRLKGIVVPEVNWKQLLRDKKPEIEPLAHLVPRDQYYVHFSHFGRFLEASELLEQWGGPIVQGLRLAGQDYRIRSRYERQLCLKATALAKTFGPAVVEQLAITGSDLYLREGSDVTVLFRVKNVPLFFTAVNAQIAEARKTWGDRLKETKTNYRNVAIESFVTPLREVSMHRCTLDNNVVVYSNSLVAIQRIIDTARKQIPALADADDFRYIRTIFRCKDEAEDSFVFFSDAFLRHLLGPVTRIKESRRVEALTSLYMLHHAALYVAWETGQLPANHQMLMKLSGLQPNELYQPEGKELRWDGEAKLAVSDAYNTLHFATPLIELPLEHVTEREADAYTDFRSSYEGLWRAAFDPIGMRLQIRPERVVAETHILPLVNIAEYRELRREIGGELAKLDLDLIPPEGVVYFLVHVAQTSSVRRMLSDILLPNLKAKLPILQAIGDVALFGIHDDPLLAELAETAILVYTLGTIEEISERVWIRRVVGFPVTAGLEVKNPLVFAGVLSAIKALVDQAAPQMVTWETLEKDQHGVKIVAIRPTPGSLLEREINPPGTPPNQRISPGLYYCTVGGMFYVSLREDILRQVINRQVARTKEKDKNNQPATEAHLLLHFSPEAGKRLWPVILWALETQIASSAMANTALLYPIWRGRLVPADAREQQVLDAAYRVYGFAPVSPDGTGFVYDVQRDEVANERHGALNQPWFPRQPAHDSPCGRLLQSLRYIRVAFQFREDGAFTVLTIERQPPSKQ